MFSILLQLFGIYGIVDIMVKVIAKYFNIAPNELWDNIVANAKSTILGSRFNYDPASDASLYDDFWGIFSALYPSEVENVKKLSQHNYQIQGVSCGHSGLPEIWFVTPLTDPCEREKMGKICANALRNHLAVHRITSPVLVDWRQDINGLPILCLRYAITAEQQAVMARTQKLACDATIGDLNARPTIEDLFT